MNDYMKFIKNKLTNRELLEQLAEECCELAHASLKLIRAGGDSNNVTPVVEKTAAMNVREELDDVLMVLCLMTDICDKDLKKYMNERSKWERWAKRLGYTQEKE